MSQPTPYTPTTDFSQQEANNASGRSTVNTAALDAEFAAIDTTLDQTLANIQLLQRDDGRLMDVSVEMHTLSPEVLNLMGGFNLRGAWLSNTDYSVNDLVSSGSYTYVCSVAHNSGPTFSETNWLKFGFAGSNDAAQAAAAAAVSANEAHISELAAAASASSASGFATTATTQAGLASSSATAADASADAAAISETNAANSASDAASSASSISVPGGKAMVLKDSAGVAYLEGVVGTTAQRPGSPIAGYTRFNTTLGYSETWSGYDWVASGDVTLSGTQTLLNKTLDSSCVVPAAALQQKITSGGTVNTTSGTTVSITTALPAWAKKVTINLIGVSTNGTDLLTLRLGPVAGLETSGYLGAVENSGGSIVTNFSGSCLLTTGGDSSAVYHGTIHLTLSDASANTWSIEGICTRSDAGSVFKFAGSKSLAGALTQFALTTASGADTYDLGKASYTYE